MLTDEEVKARNTELHQQFYQCLDMEDMEDTNRFRPDAAYDKWGITVRMFRDANPNNLSLHLFSQDQAGAFYWPLHHTRKTRTYTLHPLRNHPDAGEWQIRINCRSIMDKITVTSQKPGARKAESIASVHSLDLALACAHEHIRRCSTHVIREVTREKEPAELSAAV